MGSFAIIALVIGYILVMIGIGYWSSRRVKTVGDFMLGGRTIGPWMNAFAYATTVFAPWFLIGLPGDLGWYYGLKAVWAGLAIALIGVSLAWLALAGRAREMSARLNAVTLPEFFGERFHSRTTHGISALITVSFSFLLAVAVYGGLAMLARVVLGLTHAEILIFLAALSAITLTLGGYYELAVGGFFRGVIQFLCVLILILTFAAGQHGGLLMAWRDLIELTLNTPSLFVDGTSIAPSPYTSRFAPHVLLFCLTLLLGVGVWGMPHLIQKFFAMRRRADVPIATAVAGVFTLLIGFGIFFLGAVTRLSFTRSVVALIPMPELLTRMLDIFGEQWQLLLLLALVVSAAMNLLSSLLLTTAGGIVLDLGGVVLERRIREHKALIPLRILVVVLAGLSLLAAIFSGEALHAIFLFAWTGLAGAFAMPFAYSLFWKRATRMGVNAGMIAGFGTAIGLILYWGLLEAPAAGLIALTVSFLVTPLVSLLTAPPDPDRVEAAFHDQAILPKQRGEEIVFGEMID